MLVLQELSGTIEQQQRAVSAGSVSSFRGGYPILEYISSYVGIYELPTPTRHLTLY